jgi:P22 coat protein - gene protein 5
MALGSNHMTTATAANFIPELWALDVLEAAESNLVMAKLVTRFDDVAAEGGDIIHVPRVSNFAAQSKAANTQVSPQSTADDKVGISLTNHKEVSFLIEDIVSVQAKSSLREIYTKKAGYAIAKAIDANLIGLYASLSNFVDAEVIGTDDLIEAMSTLDGADAPAEDRFLVICPEAKADIMTLDKFTNRDYMAPDDPNTPTQTGLLGDIFGCKVYMSNNVVTTTASGVDMEHNLMFQKGAFALAIQLGPRVQANYVPEYLGTLVTVDVIYGYALLNGDFAVDIQTY